MVFRLTPVLLAFFLSALLAVSGFLLWASYKNAQEALHFEQLKQVNRTHELAQQFLNYRLKESKRSLEMLSVFRLDANGKLFSDNVLKNTIFDYAVRYEKPLHGEMSVIETYGLINPTSLTPLKRNDRWLLRQTERGLSLSYQFEFTYQLDSGQLGVYVIKAGIYLKDNFSLINEIRQASNADAHQIIYNEKPLVSTMSLEEGVSEITERVLTSFSPVLSDLENEFSGDVQPLRIEKGTKGLYLVSVTLTQGTLAWKESFKDTIFLSLQFILIVALIVTFLLRVWAHRSLGNLLNFATSIRHSERNVLYKPGKIKEFNELGSVIENMVEHLSEQANYITGLVESANSPIISWDLNGKINVYNKAAQELLGDMNDGDTIQSFLNVHKGDKVQKAVEDAAKGIETKSLETKVMVNGQFKYILWSVAPLYDVTKNVSGAITQGQDITKNRYDEERLILSSQVFESMAEAILITDITGIIIDVNTAFTDITGYNRSEVIGQNPSVMKSGRHSKEFYENMWQSLKKDGIWRGEIWDRRKNGEEFPKWLSISAAHNENGELVNYVAVFSDISSQKEDEEKLERLAHFDPLTGLPNRVLFQDRLYTSLARAKRDKDILAVLFVDLDRFKQVNDTLGHRVGDLLLKEVSNRLLHSVREIDTVARLSGDEFTVILTDITTTEDIELIASRIVKSVGAPYFFEGHELFVSASVGISVYPTDGETGADLLRHADVAMYHAKEIGRNNFQFFDLHMNEHTQSQMTLANQLRIALNRNVVSPHFQLKVDTMTGRPVGLEALARWTNDDGVSVSPAEFIPVAEEHGLIVRVGMSILRQACEQARQWQDMQFEFGTIAINLSAQQFRDKKLIEDIKNTMEDFRLDPSRLEMEVTENMMMDDVEGAIEILNSFKDMGMKISIDDFGTGYSSLSYLKRFPVDTLKIDRSFVCELTPDSDDAAIVTAIVSLAKTMNINVVAEGVETLEQSDYLRSIGCNIVQGFLYAKPCSGGEIPIVWGRVEDEYGT